MNLQTVVFLPEIKSLFVHPFLAERIISMLNYFLQHLVGPKMGALKVKDFSEFDFKPQQLVSDICTIYLNLGYVIRGVSLLVAGAILVILGEKCLVTLELFFSFEFFAMGMWLLWGDCFAALINGYS